MLRPQEFQSDGAPASEAAGASADRQDDALFIAFAAGDADAFDRLYDRHRSRSYRYFLRQLPRDQAEDCFQQLWLKAIDERCRFQPQGRFSAWLYTLAHRLLMDQHRRNRLADGRPARSASRSPAAVETASAAPAQGDREGVDEAGGSAAAVTARDEPDRAADLARAWQRLLTLLEALPSAQRDAWLLQQEAGLSLQDIAQVTGDGVETIKSRLRYATRTLRAGLEPVRDHD